MRADLTDIQMSPPRKIKRYGWKPDLPDPRDEPYRPLARVVLAKLPEKIDLRTTGLMPPVYDQGDLGSCTANGIAAAIQFEQARQKNPVFTPSRLFIYYLERALENTIMEDAGAEIRDGIKVVAKWGAPDEALWPYDIAKFAVNPTHAVYGAATHDLVTNYRSVAQNLDSMRSCLGVGYPIIIGFTVYNSFESQAVARTGHVPMPGSNESPIGGHCVLVVGYDDINRLWLVRNSWGPSWGMAGYCTMPYDYLTNPNLASDFWTIRSVTG